jgi:hypothetical protein
MTSLISFSIKEVCASLFFQRQVIRHNHGQSDSGIHIAAKSSGGKLIVLDRSKALDLSEV